MPTSEQNRNRGRIMRARIETFIKKNGSATMAQLCHALGRSPSTVYNHIMMMCAEDLIHNRPYRRPENKILVAVWYLGPDPDPALEDQPTRTEVKVWTPHHVRDPLVAFLFGAAQLEHRP